jgi:hypothetical protein
LKNILSGKLVIITTALVLAAEISLYSGTKITDSLPVFSTDGKKDLAAKIQTTSDNFGGPYSSACLMSNLSGYPIGSSVLKGFPHFLVGVSFSSGLANMEFFDKEADLPENSYPAVSLSPAAFFGLGIEEDLDILGKLMLYSDGFYMPPLGFEMATLKKINIYSVGAKIRKAVVKDVTVLPGVFKFGGVALSGGIDYMYGVMKFTGALDMPYGIVELSGGDAEITLETDYTLQQKWYVLSGSSTALAYVHLFWIFSAYTGVGISANYGSVDLSFIADSNVMEEGNPVSHGTIGIESINEYSPYYFAPLYIIGFELDLFLFKMTFETMVNLRNGSDINLQFGGRLEY